MVHGLIWRLRSSAHTLPQHCRLFLICSQMLLLIQVVCVGSTVDWRYGLSLSMEFDLFSLSLPANIQFPSPYYVEQFRFLKQLSCFASSEMLCGLFKQSSHPFSHLEHSLYTFLPPGLCKHLPLSGIFFPEQKIWQRFGNFSLSFSLSHIILCK